MGSCDCGKGCAKCLLILFNVLFFLTGAALFAVGLWIRFDDSVWTFIDFASLDKDDKYVEYGAYLLIAVGGFILVTGFFGLCGALRESKFLLGMYIFVLMVVFLAEIAGGVLVIIFQDQVKDDFRLILLEKFQDEKTNYVDESNEYSAFATSMNLAQKEFECCGINGPLDYETLNSTKLKPCKGRPCSCYKLENADNDKNPNDFTDEDVNLDSIHEQGCEKEIIDFFEQYSVVFIGLAIGFACIQVFSLIFAVCLCVIGGKGD